MDDDGVPLTYIKGDNHEQVVKELVRRGFNRILAPEIPHQNEPLGLRDSHGREWSAMEAVIHHVEALPVNLVSKMDEVAKKEGK